MITNEYSANLPIRLYYKKKRYNGRIDVVLPQRGCMVVGSPGSGKSYCVINQFIKQQIEKSYALYRYGFKFPDLNLIVYNHLLKNKDKYKANVQFYVINLDGPRHNHRCSPINPAFMSDIADVYESAYAIMLNLNKTWIQKQGDFFVESLIVLLVAIIWYLKIYENRKYCTLLYFLYTFPSPRDS